MRSFSSPIARIWFRYLDEGWNANDYIRFWHDESDYGVFLGARKENKAIQNHEMDVIVSNPDHYDIHYRMRTAIRTIIRHQDTNRFVGTFSWMNVINQDTTGPELSIHPSMTCLIREAERSAKYGPTLHIHCEPKMMPNPPVEHNFYVQRLSSTGRPLVGFVSLESKSNEKERKEETTQTFLHGRLRMEGEDDFAFVLENEKKGGKCDKFE
jgi:hypothetical protein